MEVLLAETKEMHRLKNSEVQEANNSPRSSTIDDDEDEDDRLSSHGSVNDEKISIGKTNDSTKSTNDHSSNNENNDFSISSLHQRTTSNIDYQSQRDRLAKEFKDYEDRWLAHRNFLLYSQSLAMKGEERDRVFSQLNPTHQLTEENSPLHQLQLQQQLFHRLSKEERDRFFAAALYQQTNPYNFPTYPWNNPTNPSILSPNPTILSQLQTSSSSSSDTAQPPQPKSPSSDDSGNQSNSGSTTEWTFEEQFRQLYELSDEPKRKEFLDDLFAFMQKRGTPVNRIPIMAKHVLDLYELFRLVVSKGGLVEVINKKLWREVTKGLNLPSSITSAAFTLRTQYMKYLYPYECEKLQLSSPTELQAAIEGNRREGRRPSYAFEYSSPPQIMPPPPPPPAPTASSGAGPNPFLPSPLAHRSLDPNHAAMAAALSNPFFLAAAAASSRDLNDPLSSATRIHSSSSSVDDHHSLVPSPSIKRSLSPTRTNEDVSKRFSSPMNGTNLVRPTCFTPNMNSSLLSQVSKLKIIAKENNLEQTSSDKSITLSIELNGISYQGTLHATSIVNGKD